MGEFSNPVFSHCVVCVSTLHFNQFRQHQFPCACVGVLGAGGFRRIFPIPLRIAENIYSIALFADFNEILLLNTDPRPPALAIVSLCLASHSHLPFYSSCLSSHSYSTVRNSRRRWYTFPSGDHTFYAFCGEVVHTCTCVLPFVRVVVGYA